MCFSAVYLQHHYVIDVLFGTTYAVITLLLVSAWERRRVVQTP
jgi:membrane-associated phospholipid phosphatase